MRTMSTAVLAAAVAGGIAGDGWARGGGGANHVLLLDEVGDYVIVPHHPAQNVGPQGLTIEYWVRWNGGSWNVRGVQKAAPSACEYALHPKGWWGVCSSAALIEAPDGTLPVGEWFHIAGTYSPAAGSIRLYLNGDLIASEPGTGNAPPSDFPLVFGMQPGFGSTQLIGRIDNVRLWNRARTGEEIRATMATQFSAQEAATQVGLVASWTFEDGLSDGIGVHHGSFGGAASIVVDDLLRPPCVGDVDGTGAVDGVDLATILTRWGAPAAKFPEADTNDDGLIDGADLAAVLSGWGACP